MLEKSKHKTGFHKRRRYLIGALLISAVILMAGIFFPYSPDDSNLKTSLDAEFVPTAEYLLNHPEPEVEFVKLDVTEPYGPYNIRICVEMSSQDGRAKALRQASDIFLNGEPVNFMGFEDPLIGMVDEKGLTWEDYHTNRCYFGKTRLQRGIQLLEVRLKYWLYDEPFHVHQWAFEITGDG
jgi:hypothetical protein